MNPRFSLFRHTALSGAALLLIFGAPARAAVTTWKGSGTGGDATWNSTTNWSGGSLPTSTDAVDFDRIGVYTAPSATVGIGTGTVAQSGTLRVRYGKSVTLQMADTASLTVANILVVGGGANTASSLLVEGPASGSATASIGRIYMDANTGQRNTVTLSGSNLTVYFTTNYSHFDVNSALIVTNGAKLDATSNLGGQYFIRAGSTGGVYANRMIIRNGSVTGSTIDNTGLFQLSAQGSLAPSAYATSGTMNVYARSGGRFEAEGSGIGAKVFTRIFNGGTLAVGLSDPDTGGRSAAGSLTLNSTVQLDAGSILEFNVFGSGSANADQITIGSTGSLRNVGTGAVLKLSLNGYNLKLGDSWSLFTGNTTAGITGTFDLSQIDTSIWNLSGFNAAGGWTVVSNIPEPTSAAMLLLGGAGFYVALRRRKRRA